jgi:hypothetical protein
MADYLDPATRARVTAAGGRKRAASLTETERAAVARAGAAAVNSPAGLARRIVSAWPELSPLERTEVRRILAAVLLK